MLVQRQTPALLFLTLNACNGFIVTKPSIGKTIQTTRSIRHASFMSKNDEDHTVFDPLNLSSNDGDRDVLKKIGTMTSVVATTMATAPTSASAAGPDWGLFEGKTGSLLHPVFMGSMFLFSLSTAFLGFQWRRQRTIGDEINTLKKTMPAFKGASLSEAIATLEAAEEVDSFKISQLKAALPTEAQLESLKNERKELSAQGNRDKHYAQGSLLAFIGTLFAIEGPLNTYARAGKLFPGPHLYAGAALVVLWAAAAATVPSMQKGSDTARTIHIGANLTGLGLFAWQVQSGIPILLKVWEKTSWP